MVLQVCRVESFRCFSTTRNTFIVDRVHVKYNLTFVVAIVRELVTKKRLPLKIIFSTHFSSRLRNDLSKITNNEGSLLS